MDQNKIGKFIAECRKNKKLTQEELANKLNVSNKSVSRWENGVNMPDISLFKPLCEILDISIEELLSGEHNNNEGVYEYIKYQKKRYSIRSIILIVLCILVCIISAIYVLKNKPYLDGGSRLDDYKFIAKINDNSSFYSIYDTNTYITLNNKRISLDEALKDSKTLKRIMSHMKPYAALNDSGSLYFKDTAKGYYLAVCKNLNGNNNIYLNNYDFQSDINNSPCNRIEK